MGMSEGGKAGSEGAFPPERKTIRSKRREGRYLYSESFAFPWFAWYPVTVENVAGARRTVWFKWVWRKVHSCIGVSIIDSYQEYYHYTYNPDVAG